MDRKKLLRIILVSLILLILIISVESIKRLTVLGLLVLANFVLAISKRYIPTWHIRKYFIGVEAVMFCTVITSITFGPVTGSIMGALLMTINYIGEKRFSQYFPLTLLLYAIIGYAAFYIQISNIIVLGLILTVIYNIVSSIIVYFFGANMRTVLVFNLVNILFNLFLFSTFGGFFLGLL